MIRYIPHRPGRKLRTSYLRGHPLFICVCDITYSFDCVAIRYHYFCSCRFTNLIAAAFLSPCYPLSDVAVWNACTVLRELPSHIHYLKQLSLAILQWFDTYHHPSIINLCLWWLSILFHYDPSCSILQLGSTFTICSWFDDVTYYLNFYI